MKCNSCDREVMGEFYNREEGVDCAACGAPVVFCRSWARWAALAVGVFA